MWAGQGAFPERVSLSSLARPISYLIGGAAV
jgi:hypothetical protein